MSNITVEDPRAREAAGIRAALRRALKATDAAIWRWGSWVDAVRQDAEQRHHRPWRDNDPVILADPEYGAALDLGRDLRHAEAALAGLWDRFEAIEATPPPDVVQRADTAQACSDHRPVCDDRAGWWCSTCGADAPPEAGPPGPGQVVPR